MITNKNNKDLAGLLENIYRNYAQEGEGAKRNYLGCSSLGQPCARKLWYSYHWFSEEKPEGRIYRLFNTGNREEERVLSDLEKAGITIVDRQRAVSYGDGKLRGHLDAVLEWQGKTFVAEIKTHNRRSFEALATGGVRRTKPEHYTQLQCYLYLSGIEHGLYIAVCKDDDQYHLEGITLDSDHAESLLRRGLAIVNSYAAPERISHLRSIAPCNYCGFKKLCHKVSEPTILQSCRTCRHRLVSPDSSPTCGRNLHDLTSINEAGCDQWLPKDEYVEFWGIPQEIDGVVHVTGRNGVTAFGPGAQKPC